VRHETGVWTRLVLDRCATAQEGTKEEMGKGKGSPTDEGARKPP
jgi:ribosomal protein L16/L10AE